MDGSIKYLGPYMDFKFCRKRQMLFTNNNFYFIYKSLTKYDGNGKPLVKYDIDGWWVSIKNINPKFFSSLSDAEQYLDEFYIKDGFIILNEEDFNKLKILC